MTDLTPLLLLIVTIIGSVGGGTWLVSHSIGNVRSELGDRISTVEGKLDVLIAGLDIRVGAADE